MPKDTMDLIERFANADNICVFGLGKLWRDHFYQEYWHKGLEVTVFSDNNSDLHETSVNEIKCVEPIELRNYENLLVVIFVKNTAEIISQLNALGIDNSIRFEDLYSECIKL